ncbi:MAG: SoxR reducing system RseC family protein [Oscillospiraceae bacterium]|nr:SoxR reducing system RseC family protein [Oscillospiraceae bacterium]
METLGIVESVDGRYINVRIDRESACGGNCGSCGGCGGGNGRVVRVLNSVGAKEGSRVVMKMSASKVLFAAFLVYIVPFIVLFAAYAAVFSVTGRENISAAVSVAALCVSFAAVHAADKKLKDKYTLIVHNIL